MQVSASGKAEHAQIVDIIKDRVISWGCKVAEPQ